MGQRDMSKSSKLKRFSPKSNPDALIKSGVTRAVGGIEDDHVAALLGRVEALEARDLDSVGRRVDALEKRLAELGRLHDLLVGDVAWLRTGFGRR